MFPLTNATYAAQETALKRINDETHVDISVGQLKDTMKSLRTNSLKEKRRGRYKSDRDWPWTIIRKFVEIFKGVSLLVSIYAPGCH